MKQNMTYFIHTQTQKQFSMKVTLMIYLNQSILQLHQTYKISLEKGSGQITDSVMENNTNTSKYDQLAGQSAVL